MIYVTEARARAAVETHNATPWRYGTNLVRAVLTIHGWTVILIGQTELVYGRASVDAAIGAV